jgi:hypothetical protein
MFRIWQYPSTKKQKLKEKQFAIRSNDRKFTDEVSQSLKPTTLGNFLFIV